MTTVEAPPVAWPGRREPWPHQLDALTAALPQPGYMLPIPMGHGKSACAIAVADATDAMRVLVLCPKSVCGIWPAQVTDHSNRTWRTWAGQVAGARGPLKDPSVKRRAEQLADEITAAARLRRPLLVVVNFEAAASGLMADALHRADWDLVIIDESHRLKAPSGKQSKYVGKLCLRVRRHGGRILALTGTPMPHSALDLWGQMRALDEHALGTSYVAFRARYGAPKVQFRYADGTPKYLTTPNGQVIYDGVRDDRADELMARVAHLMLPVDADALDKRLGLTDPVDVYRTATLDPATRRAYDALEADLIARVGDGYVTAANAMVLVLRLAQAASGYAVDAETGDHIALSDTPEKARLLADVLEDLPLREPVVVFARFHADLDAIRKACERSGRRYGELSGRRRDGLTDRSTMSGDIDVLGAQLKSGGVGVDFTRAKYCIYYSLDFNLADYLQSRKRLHRPGQDGQVTYIHLLAEATVDQTIYSALSRREEINEAVMRRLLTRSTP
jgi:SNF2 family DNA or RNA helicase